MSELKVIVIVKKAENGQSELDVRCVADIEGFKGTDTLHSLKVDDTLIVLIPVEPLLARGPEYIVGQWSLT